MPIAFGINTWTWVSPFKTENAKTLFPKIKEMGFDLVEVALEDPSHVDADVLRDLLLDNGLGVSVCGAFGPSRDLTSEDPAAIENSLEYIERALEISATVGASVFAGPMYSAVGKARQVPPDQKKREFDMAVD